MLTGKTAIVTGAGSMQGIGRATARLFAAQGARVALLDVDADAVHEAAAELGAEHRAYACDVSSRDRCREVAEHVRDSFGSIDVLVSCAGVVFGTRVLDIAPEEYELVLEVNLRGTFHMAQAVVGAMRARRAGAIVCVSSIAGQSGGGVFGSSHYAAAKAGIFGLAKALARELAPDGIRVNAVAPGPIDNDFTKGRMTRAIKERIAQTIPMGRLGRPEEVAGACLFLASEYASYVTGSVLDVNGGLLIH